MAWFNVLLSISCFLCYSFATAMNKSDHYLSDDMKKLILFRSAKDSCFSVPQEIKDAIVVKGYFLYRKSLPLDKEKIKQFESIMNNPKRLERFSGKEIHFDNSLVLMMNYEGRIIFMNLKNHVEKYNEKTNDFRHFFSGHIKIKKNALSLCSKEFYVMEDDYNKILDLPLELRRFVGDLCLIPVLKKREPIFSWLSISLGYSYTESDIFDIEEECLVPEVYAEAIHSKYRM